MCNREVFLGNARARRVPSEVWAAVGRRGQQLAILAQLLNQSGGINLFCYAWLVLWSDWWTMFSCTNLHFNSFSHVGSCVLLTFNYLWFYLQIWHISGSRFPHKTWTTFNMYLCYVYRVLNIKIGNLVYLILATSILKLCTFYRVLFYNK